MKKMYCIFTLACMLCTSLLAQEATIEVPDVTTYINTNMQEQRIFIDSQEIEDLKPESTISLLQSLGVTVKSTGGYGTVGSVSLRGFRGKDVLVTVDGIHVNSAMNGDTNFNTIPVSNIESIEIIKGAFISDVAVEGGVGGIIKITTKKQTIGTKAYVDLSALTYFNKAADRGQVKTGVTIGSGNSALTIDGNATYAMNEFVYKDTSGNKVDMTDSRVIDGGVLAQFLHYFDNGNALLIRDSFYAGDAEINGGVLSPWGASKGHQQDFNNSLHLSFDMPSLIKNWAFTTSAQYDSNNQFYTTYGFYAGEDKHLLHSIQSTSIANFTLGTVLHQDTGLNISVDILDSTQIDETVFVSGSLKTTSTVNLGEHFSIIVPLALTFSDKNVSFVPKLGLQYGFKNGTLALNAYRLHQFPTLNDLYYAGGNPNLKPEHGLGGELTLNMHGIEIPFSTSVFANYYFDKIQWYSPDPSDWNIPWSPENIGKAFYTGFDVLLDKQLTHFFSLHTNYQFVMSWLLDDGNTFADNKRSVYTPLHTLGAGGTFYGEKTSLSVTGNYVGERYTDAENTTKLLPYFLLEIAGDIEFTTLFSAYAKVSNVFNETYYETADYPTPGISATLGMRVNIGE